MLTGVFPPFMTPFTEDQRLDEAAAAFNAEKYSQTDIRGLMPLGSNGEFKSLTEEESVKVVEICRKHMGLDKVLMVGAGRESSYATVEIAKKVAAAGADFVTLLAPFYFKSKMTDEALIRHFTHVADRSPVPVLIYCAPKFAGGLLISPEVIAECADHPNIVGMKDTSAEPISGYTEAVAGKDFYVLSGSINKYLEGLKCGAVGGVLSPANYLPEECCRIKPLYDAGKFEEAEALSEKLKMVAKGVSGTAGIPGSKAGMNIMGYKGGVPRLPLMPVTREQQAEAERTLCEAGYL